MGPVSNELLAVSECETLTPRRQTRPFTLVLGLGCLHYKIKLCCNWKLPEFWYEFVSCVLLFPSQLIVSSRLIIHCQERRRHVRKASLFYL